MDISCKALGQKIENVVEQVLREHLAECQTAAAGAVQEAFLRATTARKPGVSRRAKGRRRAPSRRRSREEVAALEECLYEAVCARPGEKMAVLAEVVGATVRELNRPALVLRRRGLVRSVGQRHATRYFPIGQ
jgi:hypothetical protein